MENNINEKVYNELKALKQLIVKSDSDKPFGKYHDIFLLFLGFIFTTMAGATVSYFYQLKLNEHQKEQIDYENKKRNELDLFKNISEIITERQIMSSRLMYRLKNKKGKDEIEDYYTKYLEAVTKWSKYHALAKSFILSNYSDSTYQYFDGIKDVFVNKQHDNIIKFKETPDSLSYYKQFEFYDSIQKLNIACFYDHLSRRIYIKE